MHDPLDDLLIALNADPKLGRSAACRLAACPERWLGRRRTRLLAAELQVPRVAILRGRKVARRARELARVEREMAQRAGARIVTRRDPAYPRALLDVSLPPAVLYVGGELPSERAWRERREEERTEAGERVITAATADRSAAVATAAGLESAMLGAASAKAPAAQPDASNGSSAASGTALRGDRSAMDRALAADRALRDEPFWGVAVVGARRANAYGLEVAEGLGRGLSQAGVTVVSGLAPGIDTAAHRGALAGGGRTLAVLGCGLGVAYPRVNLTLRRRIAREGGAVVSEFPWLTEPRPWHFPVRNRLIAALSLGTVVVQATERSGSLITAGLALDLGRDVLAVPGSIFDTRSKGPHALLRDGAAPVTSALDVLDALVGPSTTDRLTGAEAVHDSDEGPVAKLPGLQGKVLSALPVGQGRSPEEVALELGQEIDAVLGTLLELELEGRVRREPGPRYSRRSR